jgi:hypothetical protein
MHEAIRLISLEPALPQAVVGGHLSMPLPFCQGMAVLEPSVAGGRMER